VSLPQVIAREAQWLEVESMKISCLKRYSTTTYVYEFFINGIRTFKKYADKKDKHMFF